MDLSVIICTWNNCQRLQITLESLVACDVPKNVRWEIVVVNNNCTDNTQQVLESFLPKLPLVVVLELKQGLSRARNAGLKNSQGELVIFADDDVRVGRRWLASYWEAYQQQQEPCFLGGGIESEFEDGPPPFDLLQSSPPSVRGLDLGNEVRELKDEESFIAANWACPRFALEQENGFDEDKGLNPESSSVRVGEETDLMKRLRKRGMKAIYLPATKIKHWVPKHKCTIEHVADRYQAAGWESWQPSYAAPNSYIYQLTGVPKWLWKRILQRWLAWKISQITRTYSINRYLRYRSALGTIYAARASRN